MTAAELLARLPDVYDKRPDGNLGKLMAILAEQLDALQSAVARVRAWRDIDQAAGATLDRIGQNVGQERGVATDEMYRVLIKSKIARNLSTADINTIIRVISVAVNAPFSAVRIAPMYDHPTDPEPAALELVSLPFSYVNQTGISLPQFARIIQKTAAAGVRIDNVQLQGTFEFGGLPLSASGTGGLGDAGDPAGGGYFGVVFDPNDDAQLPI